ncbi:c-type cytochrome [Pedobacter sp. L105]|uniref:c-type cytochrome n=1 Tax=Pedobacter sp. L105 TaxID=1641871 RepID=UPI0020B16C78|nr:c-type cytochrome [Pedobacter sp. L105]
MKLNFIISGCIFMAALSSNYTAFSQTKKVTKTVVKTTTVHKMTVNPQEIAQGKALIASLDCMGCHNVQNKMVGPAYMDVAKKYPMTTANINTLSQKIIAGGSGNWGPVAMSPHPALTSPDAKKMVKYILSLNVKKG